MSLKFHDRESSSTPVTVQLTGKPMFQTRMSLQARALKKSNFQRIQIEEFEVLIVDMINGDTDTNRLSSLPQQTPSKLSLRDAPSVAFWEDSPKDPRFKPDQWLSEKEYLFL
ncbi:unnamed protein product [Fusarium fujikuroi]|nr:unnamed protein product [Fusarium fujikuroi]